MTMPMIAPKRKGERFVHPSYMLFAEFTACTLVKFSAETFFYQMVKTVAERFELHLVDDFIDKGILKEQFSLIKRDASLAHIKQGGIVELSDGGAMGTLHVVGIDLEHWLGVHAGLLGGRQVLISHLRGGLLGPMFYEDTTCKGTNGLVVEHILIEFIAGAMLCLMGDERVVVHMLLLVGNHTAIALALGSLTRKR